MIARDRDINRRQTQRDQKGEIAQVPDKYTEGEPLVSILRRSEVIPEKRGNHQYKWAAIYYDSDTLIQQTFANSIRSLAIIECWEQLKLFGLKQGFKAACIKQTIYFAVLYFLTELIQNFSLN
ncbi:hypothetical protein D3C75_894220 [compost metagenome]